MRDIAGEWRNLGCLRIGLMLKEDFIAIYLKRLRRLDRGSGLAVQRCRGRKRTTGAPELVTLPCGPSKRWSLGFLADTFGAGRGVPRFTVIPRRGAQAPRGLAIWFGVCTELSLQILSSEPHGTTDVPGGGLNDHQGGRV